MEDRYRERPNVRRLSTRRRRDEIDDIFADDSVVRAAHEHAAARGRAADQRPRRGRARAPRDPEVVQRRPGRRGQVQGLHPGHHQPAGVGERPLEAPDRLRLRPHLCPGRRHAADRRQGVPAHAAQRRALQRGARAADREGLLQPVRSGRRSRRLRQHGPGPRARVGGARAVHGLRVRPRPRARRGARRRGRPLQPGARGAGRHRRPRPQAGPARGRGAGDRRDRRRSSSPSSPARRRPSCGPPTRRRRCSASSRTPRWSSSAACSPSPRPTSRATRPPAPASRSCSPGSARW